MAVELVLRAGDAPIVQPTAVAWLVRSEPDRIDRHHVPHQVAGCARVCVRHPMRHLLWLSCGTVRGFTIDSAVLGLAPSCCG
jgi:hypothetical protein